MTGTAIFKWNASANLSFVTNEVTRLAEGVSNIEAGGDQDFGSYNITNTAIGQPTFKPFMVGWWKVSSRMLQRLANMLHKPPQQLQVILSSKMSIIMA
jgi:hypothetical protein